MENKTSRSSFTGSIGFVLAAAGSAVGLGNLWRFPYLAAKYGGGMFILVYVVLAVTFGFALMVTEIAIGRKTKLSPYVAFGKLKKKWSFIGHLETVVPIIILPYYCLIGGWVTKYTTTMLTNNVVAAAQDNYFNDFISSDKAPIIAFMVFITLTALIIILGVNKGIEKLSKVLMPLLILLMLILTVVVLSQPGAIDGVKYYLLPNIEDLNFKTILAALGQLFYSMSLAMGIMITYGSYLSESESIVKAARKIEIFDTGIALLSGLIIVPAVFVFSGGSKDALGQGPGLMFVTLPKVFESMSSNPKVGSAIGFIFFVLVFFAAITSSVSIMEAIVSGICDKFPKINRIKATILVYVYASIMGIVCSLGYGVWADFKIIGMQILDFLDFASNNILMPIVALLTCIFVGFIIKPKSITDEIELNGPFKGKNFYGVFIKWVAPVAILAILATGILSATGVLKI